MIINDDVRNENKLELKEPKILSKERGLCPICKSHDLDITAYIYEVPSIGQILMTVAICEKCGYKFRDVTPIATLGKKVKIIIRIEKPDDLRTIVYRSSTAIIKIPELELEITPGPAAIPQITTIDGVIEYILEYLTPMCNQLENPEKCLEIINELSKAMNGERQFTLIIEDPGGASFIVKNYTAKIDVMIDKEVTQS